MPRTPIPTAIMKILGNDNDALAFLTAVKVAFQHNMNKYNEFLKLLKLFQFGVTRISPKRYDYDKFLNLAKARMKELLEEHTHLILGFNTFMPKHHHITLPFQLETTGKHVKKGEENRGFPWDVLEIISKTLDFDDHFQFANVCKNWRVFHKVYWRNFLASQEPLLLQISCHGKGSFSFLNILDQKVYCSNMGKYFFPSAYVTISSGYFIMARFSDNSFMLMNPFTRIKKVVNTSTTKNPFTRIKKVVNTPTSKVDSSYLTERALLAFGKCSEEFVMVILCQCRLYVYQSRNYGWVAYSTMEDIGSIVDFAVLHNIIYVVTNKANIGVLSLNSANIKFLKLNSTPDVGFCFYPRLVICDGQLLVVDVMFKEIRKVYKIDFSTMNYVKLETLGDIALFYVSNKNCYALSNPKRWGYESNYVYVTKSSSTKCCVYPFGDKKLQKYISLPTPHGARSFISDWCFRHPRLEVDYSLAE